MIYLLALLAGIVGGIAGWVAAAFLSYPLLGALGMADTDGERAMTAFLSIGPLGGLIGIIAGVWLTLRYGGPFKDLGAVAGRGLLVMVAIVALFAGVAGYRAQPDTITDGNVAGPQLDFEIKLPAAVAVPPRETIRITLNADNNSTDAPLHVVWRRRIGDRIALLGSAPLTVMTAQRVLIFKTPGQPDILFKLKLAADPPATSAPGPWQPADLAADAQGGLRPPHPDEDYEIRYRVRRSG